jgi:hypothetical protein
LQYEVARKTVYVSLDLLIQTLHFHAVELGEVRIEDDFVPA